MQHAATRRIESALLRHGRAALEVSGGKDSLAVLHMARPFWDNLTVYWTNPGNPLPETVSLMNSIRALVPNFVEVAGRQREVIALDGWPSDVVPHLYTTDGNTVFGPTPFKVQPRLSCCFRSLMLPMHNAVVADGHTCIIRGKRRDEADKSGYEDGHTECGIELCFPIMEWSANEVADYLEANDVPIPGYYKYAKHSLDCMDCTAWWGDGQGAYLKANHPEQFGEYRQRIFSIKRAIYDQMADCDV